MLCLANVFVFFVHQRAKGIKKIRHGNKDSTADTRENSVIINTASFCNNMLFLRLLH